MIGVRGIIRSRVVRGLLLAALVGWAASAFAETYQLRDTTSEFSPEQLSFDLDDHPYRVSLFDPKSGGDRERLWSQTKLVIGLGFGMAGFISVLPEDVSNWDGGESNLFEDWWDNVSSGPVWDDDDWWINYIGHPYFGGVYYQVARKSGYRPWDSFVYSFLMSTFYWEYGLEAFAEQPSYQDLILTPVVGAFWGEWSYRKEKQIRQRGGKVLGSSVLGSVSLFFLDPVDSIGVGINKLFGQEVVKAGTVWFSTKQLNSGQRANPDYYLCLNMVMEF